MAKTEQDLARAVLQELQTLAAEEEPAPADADLVKDRYRSKLATLIRHNYADWSSGSIPDEAMTGLVKVIAYECRVPFGKDYSRDLMTEGMNDLRKFMGVAPTYEPVKASYL